MNKLLVLTHDLDFGFLLARSGLSGPSVIQTRIPDTSPESTGDQLTKAIRQFSKFTAVPAYVDIGKSANHIFQYRLRVTSHSW
jgi:predicted nuclease of predicted toxin-antitoxin system